MCSGQIDCGNECQKRGDGGLTFMKHDSVLSPRTTSQDK